jgi:hypothetical protein
LPLDKSCEEGAIKNRHQKEGAENCERTFFLHQPAIARL